MPELPEVETIRKSLEEVLPGKIISNVDVREKKQFVGDAQTIIGKKVTNITRKGKVLTLVVENVFVSIHLKLTGQILFAEDKNNAVFKNEIPRSGTNKMPANVTRVIIEFKDNSALFFNDLRKFGWVKLSDTMEETGAVDVLSPDFTFEYFKKSVSGSKKPIKPLLLEQDKITGIGNIYDNDALWEAKIHPERKANTLTEEELKNLYDGIKKVINEGIKYKGSSAKDEMYVLPNSEKGSYQEHFKAYHQDGKPCKRCGTIMVRINQGGRGTFFCPNCQK
jgi:formamidopyrimidine-DNA glycosylase